MKSLSEYLSGMMRFADTQILRIFAEDEVAKRVDELSAEIHNYDSSPTKIVRDVYGSIDTKATAVLQHVSVMIAISGVLYSSASALFVRVVFAIEMLLYVALALVCLRLLMSQHFSSTFDERQDAVARQAVFDITAKFTFLVSIALIVMVVVEIFVK